jgi:hypothetical protein
MVKENRISAARLVKAVILVILANLIFFLLVLAVDATIDHRVLYNKLIDVAAQGVINDQDYPPDLATYTDRYTDCVGLGLNLRDQPDRNALQLLRDSEIAKTDGIGACPALMMMLKDRNSVGLMNYSRYWHGYQILTKPFLRFGDIRNLRYILACAVVAAVFLYSHIIVGGFVGGPTESVIVGLWFATGFLLLTDAANLANVFAHSLSLLAIFSLPLAVFSGIKLDWKWPLLSAAAGVGAVNAFFDLLFNPALGLATLVVAAAAALSDKDPSVRQTLRLIAVLSFGWAMGFFGTYLCRFAIAISLAEAPYEVLRQIVTAGLFRIGGTEEKIKQVVFWATIKNFGYPMLRPSFAVFVIITAMLVLSLRHAGRRFVLRPVHLALLAPTFLSVCWFEIFRNHSQHHHWFTYRSASFSLVCLAAVLTFSLSKQKRGNVEDGSANTIPAPIR